MKEEVLVEKLKAFAAAQADEEGGTAINSFLTHFLKKRHFDLKLAEYLYHSDFFEILPTMCIEKAKIFLDADADIEWYMLTERIYTECESPEAYFNTIEKAFSGEIPVEDVRELLDDSSSVKDFENSFRKLLEKQDGVKDITLREKEKEQAARIEQLQEELLGYKRTVGKLEKEQAEYMLSLKIVNGKVRQYKEQVLAVKSVNQTISEKNRMLQKVFTAAEEKIAMYEAQIAKLERISEDEKNCIENQKKQIEQLRSENQKLKDDNADKIRNLQAVSTEPDISDVAQHGELIDEGILSADDAEVIQIQDHLDEIRDHSTIFSKVFSRYYERQFQKKPVPEQENLLFIKMMKLHFDKEKVLLVKKIMRENLSFSRLDLYKFITTNPDIEELEAYCNTCAV